MDLSGDLLAPRLVQSVPCRKYDDSPYLPYHSLGPNVTGGPDLTFPARSARVGDFVTRHVVRLALRWGYVDVAHRRYLRILYFLHPDAVWHGGGQGAVRQCARRHAHALGSGDPCG